MSCDNNYNNNGDEDGNGKENAETWIGHKNFSNMFRTVPSICSSNLKEVVVVGEGEAGPSKELPSTLLLPSSSTVLTPRSSTEDLSEYTDADESISAPTEFLAEFLSAVMMRDFTTALKYCKLILQYEPNNSTAKEFYPLILEKLKSMSDENDTSSDSSASEDNSDAISVSGEKHNNEDSDATTASYSSLEDEEVDSKASGVNEAANLSQIFPVSSKVHTTRHKARAILNEGSTQIVLLDTPGLVDVQNSKRHNLEKSFLVDPELSIKESDLIAVIHDVSNAWTRDRLDIKILRLLYFHRDKTSMLILNKVDAMKSKRKLLDLAHTLTCGSLKSPTDESHSFHGEITVENTTKSSNNEEAVVESQLDAKGWPGFECVFMISALKGIGVNDVKDYILQKSIPGSWVYSSDVYTDQKLEEIVILAIKEKLLELLPQEIPYNVKTRLDHLYISPTGDVTAVASVSCSNKRQQKLIIGYKGEKIKEIARGAEEALMNTLMENVRLKVMVECKH